MHFTLKGDRWGENSTSFGTGAEVLYPCHAPALWQLFTGSNSFFCMCTPNWLRQLSVPLLLLIRPPLALTPHCPNADPIFA